MIEIVKTKEERIEDFRRLAGNIVTEDKIGKLEAMGYFTLPASISHHGKEEGDLYLHSRTVATLLEEFTRKEHLTWQRPESPRIIGLFHDLCKTDEYERREAEGDPLYHYFGKNGNAVLPGHGENSVILTQAILPLTEEEILCIRYHMGAFEGREVWSYLQRVAGRNQNILWTIQADLIASWGLQV